MRSTTSCGTIRDSCGLVLRMGLGGNDGYSIRQYRMTQEIRKLLVGPLFIPCSKIAPGGFGSVLIHALGAVNPLYDE